MPKQLFTVLLCCFIIYAFATRKTIAGEKNMPVNLMPMPQKISLGHGKFRLNDKFMLAISGSPHQRLYRNANRALRRLSGRTGLFFAQHVLTPGQKVEQPALLIKCDRPGKVMLGEDESYTIKITEKQIVLHAVNDIGANWGLESLLQLLQADANGYFFPACKITDAPRFKWRGLLIDVGRHFMPVQVIKRNLDGMAAVKLNVLHWHLSDDQGFRVESKVFPKLHEMGSDGFYYTREQIREVLAYADIRGIRVVPEFDVPGHATSWLVGYPELGSAPGPYEIERGWGIKYPAINPISGEALKFLDKFFAEMAALFPDPYFHIGGDEVEQGEYHKAEHWNKNPEIQAFMKKHGLADNAALQAYFNRNVLKILTKHGKIMIGWEEILHESMPRNVVIQSWRGTNAMVDAARAGFGSILSKGYYIDLIQPAEFHYLVDPLPADSPLNADEQKLILGGEATMWSEFVSAENIDSRIWPRTAAIAERFWSPANVNDVADMYRRLHIISLQLEEHGLTHEKNYEMMLRRLVRSYDIQTLKTFVDVVEPVKIYRRNGLREHFTSSPLTRVIDTARPDAEIARMFRWQVKAYLQSRDENLAREIRNSLEIWRDNHAALVKLIDHAPVLREIQPLSEALARCAELGLQALNVLANQQKFRQDDFKAAAKWFTAAKENPGQIELMVAPAIEKLVAAARN